MRLGKLAPRISPNAPSLARLMVAQPPPASADWTGRLVGAPLFLNDILGTCTIATVCHITRVWTSQVYGQEVDIPDELARSTYFGLTGGPDSGLAETTALEWWASKGFSLPDRQFESLLTGWATCNNYGDVRRSVAWLGASYIGLNLPAIAQDNVGGLWDVPKGQPLSGNYAPGSWGMHAVPAVSYDTSEWQVLTWGNKQRVTQAFLDAYLDEAHAPLSRLWVDTMGVAPSGLDWGHLERCMAGIGD